MSEPTTQPTPNNLAYTAALVRKMLSPLVDDPGAADFARLTPPMLEIALAVHSEGRDEGKRRARLKAEIAARGLDALQAEIEAADPNADLSALQGEGWQSIDLADVINEPIPPITWLVKPYLPRPSVTAWFGKPKAMKSLLVLDMCLHVAGGYAWLSSTPDGKDGVDVTPARVVWLDLENGVNTLKRRMKAIAKALGMEAARDRMLAYSMPTPWPDLSKNENAAALITRLNELGEIGVLVIDHLGQVFGPVDENSPLASQVMGTIRQISESCNLAIVLIHHAKKGQGRDSGAPEDQLRGSGAILAGVDGAYLIERDKADKTNLKLIPVAVRGPDAPNVSARFAFEQDENLDLTQARFWRIAWRKDSVRAMDAVLKALENGKKNFTQLVAAAKNIEPGISDKKIREAIATLEGTKEIYFIKGDKGAKIYELAGENDSED
ncbi:MAG: AAA family ATPase [Chloroflexota bacterium]